MLNLFRIGKWVTIVAIVIPVAVCVTYLLAATIGALIPSPHNIEQTNSDAVESTVDIYLLSTVLHVDIAVPISNKLKQQFEFLENDDFPFSHPQLKYLVFGWGSERFYTSTKTLLDIGSGPVFTAVTGDTSVLHVIPTRDISNRKDVKKLTITRSGLENMMKLIRASFAQSPDENPTILSGVNHGISDVFYHAKGKFNIFNPCNTWTARMLRSAGVKTGIWTPTTFSLMMSLD